MRPTQTLASRAPGLGVILLALCTVLVPSREAVRAQTRFDPMRHFPARPLLFASVHDLSRLRERLAGTLLGRIATHPGWKEALAGPIGMAAVFAGLCWMEARQAVMNLG